MIRVIYTIFVGILLAAFIGTGIQLFYSEPKAPTMPASLKIAQPENQSLSEPVYLALKNDQANFDQAQQKYERDMQIYNRNVSVIAIAAAIIVLVVGLTLAKQVLLITDGLLLGGVLTLSYGITRGMNTDDNLYRFIAVAAGLVVTLMIGYIKIIKPMPKSVGTMASPAG